MRLPDGTILMHGSAPYDPVKAHEYYMRNRQLHPRQKGPEQPKAPSRSHQPTFTVTRADGSTVKLTAKELAEQKAYAAHRIAQITARLGTLKQELRKKVVEAKIAARDANKPPTAAEKAKAAKDAKQYRDQHKQQLANKAKQRASKSGGSSSSSSSSTQSNTLDSIKAEVTIVKGRLKAAVADARALSSAKKNG